MTALFQRGPAEEIPRFELNLERVTICRRSIDSAICCVQSYVRNPLFIQRNFFTDNGISMLLSAVNIAGSVCEDSVYDPWNLILPEGYGAIVNVLKKAYKVVVFRRKYTWGTSEKWFGVASVDSSVVGESSGQQGVRISNIVEIGEVEFLPQSVSTPHALVPVSKALERGNGRMVRRRFQLQSSIVLSLMMSQLCCPWEGGFTLMAPISKLPWKMKIKLFLLAEVAVVPVLRHYFSQAPDNGTYH